MYDSKIRIKDLGYFFELADEESFLYNKKFTASESPFEIQFKT